MFFLSDSFYPFFLPVSSILPPANLSLLSFTFSLSSWLEQRGLTVLPRTLFSEKKASWVDPWSSASNNTLLFWLWKVKLAHSLLEIFFKINPDYKYQISEENYFLYSLGLSTLEVSLCNEVSFMQQIPVFSRVRQRWQLYAQSVLPFPLTTDQSRLTGWCPTNHSISHQTEYLQEVWKISLPINT